MKPPAFSNKATLALGINFPLLAEKLYTNTDVILWMVIRVSYLNVQWINIDRNPLCHVTSKQIPVGRELPLCWVGEKKKCSYTLPPWSKNPLPKITSPENAGHTWILTCVWAHNPTPWKVLLAEPFKQRSEEDRSRTWNGVQAFTESCLPLNQLGL